MLFATLVKGVHESIGSSSAVCQEELDEIHAQYQKLHDDTRSKTGQLVTKMLNYCQVRDRLRFSVFRKAGDLT